MNFIRLAVLGSSFLFAISRRARRAAALLSCLWGPPAAPPLPPLPAVPFAGVLVAFLGREGVVVKVREMAVEVVIVEVAGEGESFVARSIVVRERIVLLVMGLKRPRVVRVDAMVVCSVGRSVDDREGSGCYISGEEGKRLIVCRNVVGRIRSCAFEPLVS